MMDRVDQLMKLLVTDKIMDDDISQTHEEKKPEEIKDITPGRRVHRSQFYGIREEKVKSRPAAQPVVPGRKA